LGYKEEEKSQNPNRKTLSKSEKKKQKVLGRHRRNELKKKVIGNKTTIANLFVSDKELKIMREPYTTVKPKIYFC
jgi:hypothetical protein